MVYPSFEKNLQEQDAEIKNIQEVFFEIHFRSGQLS